MRYLEFERRLSEYLRVRALSCLRYSLAAVFFWFGVLKLLGQSPAADLIFSSLGTTHHGAIIIIGIWEITIGVLLFFKKCMRLGLILLFLLMPGTFLPLVTDPDACFTFMPFGLTLAGQYIVKNLVLVSAGLVLTASLHPQRPGNGRHKHD